MTWNPAELNNFILFSMVADLCQLQFVVFSFCRGEKTTKREDDKTIIIVFSGVSSFRFVVFWGRKDDNYRFGVFSRRKVDKTPSEKTTN
jgi:hypothetical protein